MRKLTIQMLRAGTPALPGETRKVIMDNATIQTDEIREKIFEALRTIYDPEIPVNIFELGLIYLVDVDVEGRVKVNMTLTAPNCPAAGSLPGEVESKVRGVPGVTDAEVKV